MANNNIVNSAHCKACRLVLMVSLDSRVREVINRNMLEPSQHIFDDAQLQIYTLMHRDSYPRFMNSSLYKDLLKSLSEKSIEA
ncbi:PREDICTED: regulator of G-protein signaling 20 [Elephantulus edwardii]|uniref:regulator of G-protein signaling 20 n=1 Tax=Elephantulus edwardii TaxID=28737 RepID=UPI0003F0B381|nr:PREDICTED: regulator of G-protein signaling 20 [Elephantulus edwardii]